MQGTLIPSYAPDFELPGVDDEVHHLARYLEEYRAVVVIFMCNHCPYVRFYLNRLKQLQQEYREHGVILVGINANDASQYPDDSFENMKIFAEEQKLNFPYIRDITQEVAHCFGASHTPEIFLLDHDGIIRYRGLIDDNPSSAEAVTTPYLKNAIAQLLNHQPITPEHTDSIGCSIKWRH
ncbi:thioredoxin family protein [Planktothrix sp. FACHB-1365]|uniref:thioredoxin family protein n=1 Tax=Planktothrix sp. FACHB-1365 TaxID=2692855 RepID=UPI0016848ED6|nr:thioredoxin family protein [Planktothrix sp. FACHB-1365]MBD2481269.1 thioredoxin family protein [Planktothrix sp. FACHB-1365]